MDHLLAAFFSLVFCHPTAVNQRPTETVSLPSYAAQYDAGVPASVHHDALPTVNRRAASYAVAGAFRSHS